jgi:nucleotide-binding universal stress UspA family protein
VINVTDVDKALSAKNNEENNRIQKPVVVKKILVAIDKSGYKEKAVAYAITLAKALGADVTALHVIDKSSLGIAGDLLGYYRGGKKESYEDAYENVLKEQAEKLLGEAELVGKKEGLKIDKEVLMHSRSVPEEIIDYAKKKNMDLIVVGTKGMTGVAKFLLGSVASKVIAHAQCPVLAVR